MDRWMDVDAEWSFEFGIGAAWIGLGWLVDISGTMGMPTAPVIVN